MLRRLNPYRFGALQRSEVWYWCGNGTMVVYVGGEERKKN